MMHHRSEEIKAYESSAFDNRSEQTIQLYKDKNYEYQKWNLKEKIIKRRILKLYQNLAQFTDQHDLSQDNFGEIVEFIVKFLYDGDNENLSIALMCIVDIIRIDQDVSPEFINIYNHKLKTNINNAFHMIDDDVEGISVVITIIKCTFDSFLLLTNYGVDVFEDKRQID